MHRNDCGTMCSKLARDYRDVRGHVALGSGSCAGGAEAVVMCGCVGQSLQISTRGYLGYVIQYYAWCMGQDIETEQC